MPIAMQCPYFDREGRGAVDGVLFCEGGELHFPDRPSRSWYLRQYCASLERWEQCSVARMLGRYYGEGEE